MRKSTLASEVAPKHKTEKNPDGHGIHYATGSSERPNKSGEENICVIPASTVTCQTCQGDEVTLTVSDTFVHCLMYFWASCSELDPVASLLPRIAGKFAVLASTIMLITKTHQDVTSKLDNGKLIRIFVIAPVVPNYPQAKFPGNNTASL